jgi:hypothetical protein
MRIGCYVCKNPSFWWLNIEDDMTGYSMVGGKAERWITQVQGGVITLVQRIPKEAFVIGLSKLPEVVANVELVGNGLAIEVRRALEARQC